MRSFIALSALILISALPMNAAANSSQIYSTGALGIGMAKDDALQIELLFQKSDNQSFYVGIAGNILWDGSVGDEKESQSPNYGKTVTGHGDGFYSFDIGWGYIFFSKIRLIAEITYAVEYAYTNYKDDRFKDGGYHMKDDEDSKFGFGSTVSYLTNGRSEFYIGYNTIKEFSGGLRIRF